MISGFIPGIHSNTISSILYNSDFLPQYLPYIIVAAAGVHTVLSFLPSMFFGIPEENTIVSVLPSQKMVLEGKAYTAMNVIVISFLCSLFLSILLLPLSFVMFTYLYSIIDGYMLYFLILASIILVLSENNDELKGLALIVFIMAGLLGLITINSPVKEPLFPIFTGLFAISTLIDSTLSRRAPSKQTETKVELNFIFPIILGVVFGFLADLFPGIASPAQVAVFASPLLLVQPIFYLAFTASMAVSHTVFAFASLITISKARVGALIYLDNIVNIDISNFLPYLIIFTISVIIGCAIILIISRKVSGLFNFNFSNIHPYLIVYLTLLVFVISGWLGIMVLICSTMIGYLPLVFGVKRVHVMGAIIIPTMVFLI